VLAGAGDAYVEQAALLLDGVGPLGQGYGQQPLAGPYQQDGVPLQALGGVQGGQGDTRHRGGVLSGGPLSELSHQGVQVGAPALGHLVSELDNGGQGLPALTHGPLGGGRLGVPALPGQDGAHVVPQVPGQGGPLGAGRGPEHHHGALDLLALEEALAPAYQVADPGTGQGLLNGLGLGVGAVQDGDLAQWHAAGAQSPHLGHHALGLGDVVVIGLVAHGGPGGTLGHELDGAGGQTQHPAPA
jgi:hypothetical protein